MEMIQLTPRELEVALDACIASGEPLLISGAPGISKTALTKRACKRAGVKLYIWHPVVSDPTDFKGLPWAEAGSQYAHFKPFGNLALLMQATEPTVVLIDDLGQGAMGTQAAIMQVILERSIDGHAIPDCITFVACTNRASDMAGVNLLIEPLKSRFVSIVELIPDVLDWVDWANSEGISPMLVAYIQYRGHEVLSNFVPSKTLTNSPSPRTWEHVSRIEAMKLPEKIERAMMAGAVGATYATEYLVFRSMYKSIVSVADIIAHPKTAPIPSAPDRLYATASALAHQADTTNFRAIATYAQRMVDGQYSDFAVFLIRTATRVKPALEMTDVYVTLQTGPMGKLFTGSTVN